MYRYLGRNGIITTDIYLEQITPIPMIRLAAEKGKILTDGQKTVFSIVIFEDEIENWQEIDYSGQD